MAEPNYGKAVRSQREALGLTRQQLAHEVGVSISTIDRLENLNGLPNPRTLARIAAVLDLSLDVLLLDTEAAS